MKDMCVKEYIHPYFTDNEDYILECMNMPIIGYNTKFPKKIIHIENNDGFKEACIIDVIGTDIQKNPNGKAVIKIRYKEKYTCLFFDIEFQIVECYNEEIQEFFLSIRDLTIKNTETICNTLINKIKSILEKCISLCFC